MCALICVSGSDFSHVTSGGYNRGLHWRDPHPFLLLHESSCTTDDVIFDWEGEEGPRCLQCLQNLHQASVR